MHVTGPSAEGGSPPVGDEPPPPLSPHDQPPCRFPKLEECAHFHYERVQLPQVAVELGRAPPDHSLLLQRSQHGSDEEGADEDGGSGIGVEWYTVRVSSGGESWWVRRTFANFRMLDAQLHSCIYDRKVSRLPDLEEVSPNDEGLETKLSAYLDRLSSLVDNSLNCGPVLNWLQMDNRGRRLLVPAEEARSLNTPAVAAAYSVRRYVSQAHDELNLEVGDMISVIDMASPGESVWWRGKRGFQVGFFPQHCVHIIGDKVPRNMPLPPPVVGSLAITPIKPVLRKHGKLITFFRSFIVNRPSRRRLKQSGILKERVFGCDLGEHLLNSGHDIPMVLKCCAEFIEKNGIVDGIYRLSGVTSNIQKLRNAFDEDRIPNLHTEEVLQDVHSVASLLKMYFRELPNPLCTYQLYQSFVDAVQGCSATIRNSDTDHERLLKMREAVQKLPPPHYRTLEYLMRHLARVAKHGARTGMTTRNVAIVWAPNLLRCEALEVGGVAALQGVGVQAVVTEFLICYADLIFCDHLPSLDLPELAEKENGLSKKCRPNSLAISTPTKLITLEEARSKHLLNAKSSECNYIEVGGGPKNLPKKYHTVIELPAGARKRSLTKRSPLGWRLFFSKNRNASQGNMNKNRKASTPITINFQEKAVTESDLTDMRRKLRTVKSAESLTSGHSEPASCEDVLGPLHSLNKPPGHNRSVSHDSYFDTLQNSQNNSEGSLLDLSEIHLNFDLEESEMRIFSEDESLVSSPRVNKDSQRRILTRARPEEFSSTTNSVNPSPKKQPRVVLSPDSNSRKRTRLEDQLSDIQYIDCSTPENVTISTTAAVIHQIPDSPVITEKAEMYQPKNKSPRNSDNLENKRQSLNLETGVQSKTVIPKSFTELDMNQKCDLGGASILTTPTPGSPGYKTLGESSANTTPGYSPTCSNSPTEIAYQHLPKTPVEDPGRNYENILTTISITYKSPPRSLPTTPVKSPPGSIYENIIINPERAEVPTSSASLPEQEASQPSLTENESGSSFLEVKSPNDRPKSLSALEEGSSNESATLKASSTSAICNTSNHTSELTLNEQRTLSSNQSSGSNVQYTASFSSVPPYQCIENSERLSPTDLSLSEVVQSSTENLTTSQTSLSFPASPSKISPIVSQDPLTPDIKTSIEALSQSTKDLQTNEWVNQDLSDINLIDFSPGCSPTNLQNEKRKSDETEPLDDIAIYQQVKYFRRSIHEVNAMLDDLEGREECTKAVVEGEETFDSLEPDCSHVYENIEGESMKSENRTYENIEGECLRGEDRVYENVDTTRKTEEKEKTQEGEVQVSAEVVQEEHVEEKVNFKDLRSKFEDKVTTKPPKPFGILKTPSPTEEKPKPVLEPTKETSPNPRQRKFYEKDGLPPCLRARNLKSQFKTRSLDEEEFNRELGDNFGRRKSLDESMGSKTNSLPKTLNQPKHVPSCDAKVDRLHMTHSNENLSTTSLSLLTEDEEMKKRERIEKYKEERRKILSQKYRSESFKEDKDVILSRLKIFKAKEDSVETIEENLPRTRRRSTKSECSSNASDSLDEEQTQKLEKLEPKIKTDVLKLESPEVKPSSPKVIPSSPKIKPSSPKITSGIPKLIPSSPKQSDAPKLMTESLKSRAAIFEQPNRNKETEVMRHAKIIQDKGKKEKADDELKDLDFIRNRRRDDILKNEERRRHTYESRERETEAEKLKRISLESRSPRKEKASPTYCIKDVKAMFERKSKE